MELGAERGIKLTKYFKNTKGLIKRAGKFSMNTL